MIGKLATRGPVVDVAEVITRGHGTDAWSVLTCREGFIVAVAVDVATGDDDGA